MRSVYAGSPAGDDDDIFCHAPVNEPISPVEALEWLVARRVRWPRSMAALDGVESTIR
jgi:hypothetical protein